MATASEVAKSYSELAAWVPVPRAMPPEGSVVEVLFADGMVAKCSRAGRLWIMVESGTYRYVEAAFWRPADDAK